jgi:hypothetical protein
MQAWAASGDEALHLEQVCMAVLLDFSPLYLKREKRGLSAALF